MSDIQWNPSVEENFKRMLSKIPGPLRKIAEEKVSQKAKSLAQEEGRDEITEKDMVDAFFAETPGGFHGPLKCDMEEFKIDYTQYGYERDEWKKIFGS